MENSVKIQRMLLWFEDQLPPHELGEVRVDGHIRYHLKVPKYIVGNMGNGSLEGHATCSRCYEAFDVDISHYHADVDEDPDAPVAKVTEALQREAEKSKCWADIPDPPETTWAAVLDAGATVETAISRFADALEIAP